MWLTAFGSFPEVPELEDVADVKNASQRLQPLRNGDQEMTAKSGEDNVLGLDPGYLGGSSQDSNMRDAFMLVDFRGARSAFSGELGEHDCSDDDNTYQFDIAGVLNDLTADLREGLV